MDQSCLNISLPCQQSPLIAIVYDCTDFKIIDDDDDDDEDDDDDDDNNNNNNHNHNNDNNNDDLDDK